MPLWQNFHDLTFRWFGLPGPLLIPFWCENTFNLCQTQMETGQPSLYVTAGFESKSCSGTFRWPQPLSNPEVCSDEFPSDWEERSMDQYQCRGKLLKNFQDHWSIQISPGKGMGQCLVHMKFPWNWYGPMPLKVLVAPYRAILRYYRCDTSYRAILFKGGWHSPKMVRYPPLLLSFTKAHISVIPPHFATYRALIVRYPIKTSTKEFCDTVATSIARYEKYRCWASKPNPQYFLKSTAIQMGGVLQYKWGRTAGVPYLQGLQARKVQQYKWGVLLYKLEVYCRTFSQTSRGWGFWKSSEYPSLASISGKKNARKHKPFGLVGLGTNPGFSLFTQWKPSLSQGHTHFLPGTSLGSKGCRRMLCVKSSHAFFSGKKKEPKPKLLVRISSRGGRGGWPKSSVCPSKPKETKLFGGISWDSAGISRGRPKSVRKKSLCSILVPLFPWTGKSCFSNRAFVKAIFEAPKCL